MVGDFDNDGDSDVVFLCLNDKPVFLRNNSGQDRSWIGFQLQGTRSNRDAIGAKLTMESKGRKQVRWVTGGSSYLASHDRRVIMGLGSNTAPDPISIEIRWPTGKTQKLSGLKPGRYHTIVEASEG